MNETGFRKTLSWKRAIGELFLIAFGVFIALLASDWQSQRAARQTEVAILKELQASLSEDLDELHPGLERLYSIENQIRLLQEKLRSSEAYDESWDELFGAVYGFNLINLNTAAYESVKSIGLDTISNDELRSELTQVYEEAHNQAAFSMEIEREVVLDLLRPYFLKNFKDLRFNDSATPIAFEFIASDTEFMNLLASSSSEIG